MRKSIHFLTYFIVFSTVLIIDKNLANGIISGKYFWFYGSMGLVSIATPVYLLKNKLLMRITLTDMFVFLFVSSIYLSAFVYNDASANSTKLVLLALLTVLYFNIRLSLNDNWKQTTELICFFIILTGMIEAIWGMAQLYGYKPSLHAQFKLTGSFFNPGPYAGYLAVVFPLALYYFLQNENSLPELKLISLFNSIRNNKLQQILIFLLTFMKKWISGITCIVILSVLPATMSRASWLAAIAGSIVIIYRQWGRTVFSKTKYPDIKVKWLRILVTFFLSGMIIASISGIYYLKKDSADGRLLTWKVSFFALVKNPSGVGLGHFPGAYGDAQAAYFAAGNATETEEYVAGNPEYGFNEFLQIAIESGISSLLLFICLLTCAFRGLIKSKNWGMTGSLIALLVFASFSYPFSVLPFLIILVFLLAMGSEVNTRIGADRKSVLIRLICVICVPAVCTVVTVFCLWKQYPTYNAYKQWKDYQIFYQAGMFRETVQSYEPLYPLLNDQIKFLFEYGHSLSQSEQPEKSNKVLRHVMQISCDPMLYNITGKNFHAMKQYNEAEQCFIKSSNIVPNRIYSYYLMALMYMDAGETEKAKAAAKTVLTKEPKVQSIVVYEMREEAKRIMAND